MARQKKCEKKRNLKLILLLQGVDENNNDNNGQTFFYNSGTIYVYVCIRISTIFAFSYPFGSINFKKWGLPKNQTDELKKKCE